MKNVLVRLKGILNSMSDEELIGYDLWIDNVNTIDVIAVDNISISLITDSSKLKIDDREW